MRMQNEYHKYNEFDSTKNRRRRDNKEIFFKYEQDEKYLTLIGQFLIAMLVLVSLLVMTFLVADWIQKRNWRDGPKTTDEATIELETMPVHGEAEAGYTLLDPNSHYLPDYSVTYWEVT